MARFIAEDEIVEHRSHLEDCVCLRFDSYSVGQVLADRDYVCLPVEFVFENYLHADAENGSSVCLDRHDNGPVQMRHESQSIGLGGNSYSLLTIRVFANTVELDNA